ncbi:ATP-dependent RNA helicase [Candidatus Pantoea edessiphila]|uniref:ATP-dependent RNA helicase DeaD n=1 Tax=Candidatus Pantoea edessiphila TaxID=2044610 RepID=A0A2P5SY65_9GAMM|nr:DEAD/DEAH box helicase [Candidatus Pantoea edessiphila]MBK4775632.1 DEAD/DEAH box helicase [Pantoea sp. Edef]PPI87279.1 ATP-dependent RNA helicase [Candidatus Pantoea edessiphila]
MTDNKITFNDFGLKSAILKSLKKMGYINPSPIQIGCIPYLLSGKDVLGMAQTGSGKTAAFALPLLNNINVKEKTPQILVLSITRELAIQVAEAISKFSEYLHGLNIIALYGGQRYDIQLRTLRQGPQVVVGTPGRLLDHLKRGTLNLSNLKGLVIDEADEMLRMGFIEDVENIIECIPANRQTALFSATMPDEIRRITKRFMKNPKEVYIKSSIKDQPDISQSYWPAYGRKIDGLIRFLEAEDFDAAIIFVRTKNTTVELASALEKHGYNSAALNSDINQSVREQTLERLKDYRIDVLIATDVAARGLDVERVSLVINYDIPLDAESYVHRIGRTGRAGRSGRALLFVENRERRLLRNIERTINKTITEVKLPDSEVLGQRRLAKFNEKVKKQLQNNNDLDQYRRLLSKMHPEENLDMETLAAVLLKIAQGERPLVLPKDTPTNFHRNKLCNRTDNRYTRGELRHTRNKLEKNHNNYQQNSQMSIKMDEMRLYRIEVGRDDGVEVRHIVGAIANEGSISSRCIGNIKLFNNHSIIELSKSITCNVMQCFNRTRILNKPINMQLIGEVQLNKGNLNRQSNRHNRNFSSERRGIKS